jgi:hypothetical protein
LQKPAKNHPESAAKRNITENQQLPASFSALKLFYQHYNPPTMKRETQFAHKNVQFDTVKMPME